MRDARTSGARPSGARTNDAHRQAATPSIASKIKKLNWFQKHILCMHVDIRKGQYDAYCERQLIISRLPPLPSDQPAVDPLSYEQWNASAQTPRVQMEKDYLESVPSAPPRPSYKRAPSYDEEDEESEAESDNPEDESEGDEESDEESETSD